MQGKDVCRTGARSNRSEVVILVHEFCRSIGFLAGEADAFQAIRAIIKSGAASVRIFSQEVAIRAQVVAIDQFSDHADTAELQEWLQTFQEPPDVTYLVHGEPNASAMMRDAFQRELKLNVKVAEYMQKVEVV